jgi:4-carboxymuconolactone decarboxylase
MSTPPVDGRRFPLIPPEHLTDEQRAVVDAIRSGPRSKLKSSAASVPGPIGGPFNVMLRSPGVGMLIQQLGEEIRFRSSIPPRLNEMAILITARHYTSQYEWYAHHKLAMENGLDPHVSQAIAQGRRPERMGADETLVYDFSTQLHAQHGVSDATYQAVLERFGERGVVDLIAVNGFYSLVSFMLNVDRTPLPAGEPLPLRSLST